MTSFLKNSRKKLKRKQSFPCALFDSFTKLFIINHAIAKNDFKDIF